MLNPFPILRYTFVVLVLSSWLNQSAQAEERPNFALIIADDVSDDDLGCYGNEAIDTPHLDQLAAEGLAFDRAYLTTSSCSPTRASIITGRYPHNTGAPELHTPLPTDQYMFPRALRDAGYYTVLAGKNHMGDAVGAAFDQVTGPEGPGGEGDWIEHLKERPTDKPFFMWIAAIDSHRDWQFTDADRRYEPAEVVVPPYLVDGPMTREDLAGQYHEITRLDRFVGKVRRELERQGVAENTFIIFSSDNGRPFPRCKTRLYDCGTKNPLIVWRPGTIAPARTDSLVSAVDIAPTVLELAGVAIDPRVQGVSFTAILDDPQATVRDYAFAEHNWHVMQAHERSVRHGDWLYIRNAFPERMNLCAESGPEFPAGEELWRAQAAGELNSNQQDVFLKPRPAEELYDTRRDPHQFRNLAGDPARADQLAALSGVLDRWVEETADSVPANPTPDARKDDLQKNYKIERGTMAGADRGAASVNAPGPICE